jgi:hypothetical protein
MKLSSSVDETQTGNNRADGTVQRVFEALVTLGIVSVWRAF